ncbi:uncharacterized protein EAE97_000062 [Botrytis byssoidea]|uniref:Uncharacterized protein n=1 Tax=Botrytis byssoidea TaxID=139641 RepID=A0A9P5IZU2_9HELO|nr:uncharacterized protein EAE97_000062 [Botrytis byssoidea]KAF7954803.1 hypothetical protein EAE97_000062 [Botrytis byssoidea]
MFDRDAMAAQTLFLRHGIHAAGVTSNAIQRHLGYFPIIQIHGNSDSLANNESPCQIEAPESTQNEYPHVPYAAMTQINMVLRSRLAAGTWETSYISYRHIGRLVLTKLYRVNMRPVTPI